MPVDGVHIRNDEPYRLALRAAAAGGLDDNIEEALDEAGRKIVVEARHLAPFLSGDLRDSIEHYTDAHRLFIEAGHGPSEPYAEVIYWGWPAHNIEETRFVGEAISIEWDSAMDSIQDAVNRTGRTFSTF